MIPELGQVALILALLLALAQGFLSIAGARHGDAAWMAMGKGASRGQLVFVVIGFVVLVWAFYTVDFSVLNVAEHSSRRLPTIYRITAAWGSHEGSILLWALILACWTVAVGFFSRSLPAEITARVIGIMGLVSSGFLSFILFTSNPFLRLHPPPNEGMDLNPLLQDPGMILHPPLLYLGYAGFAVAFAFALAALLSARLDDAWARWARPWTIAAWLFLTLGIMVGSWWAYYELGWGGWWFWDPAENASLMPWLVGTALLHSLAVTDKRNCFRAWTVFLAIGAFSLSLLGTFLVRSGILSSVHAFALDPTRGVFILLFLAAVIGGSLVLFAVRAPKVGRGGSFAPVSRESIVLTGNVLLLTATATVLLGTLYPLILDALDLGKVSVGPPYFNAVFVPMMAPVLLLMGLGPFTRWGTANLQDIFKQLKWAMVIAAVLAITLPLAAGELKWQAALGIGLATWIAFTTGLGVLERYRGRNKAGIPLAFWGMSLAHFGMAVGIAGIGLVSAYEIEKSAALAPGDTTTLAGYTLTFNGAEEVPGPNFSAMRGSLTVSRDNAVIGVLEPEKRIYHISKLTMTESAIRYGFTGDLYVALGEPLPDKAWTVRLFHKPFVSWLWAGALLMVLGAFLAAIDRRYRRAAP
jgi:cytochrome c-type biogenesis protein CcmF